MATNLTTAGSAEEKLKWAFKLYDKDESGDFPTRTTDVLTGFRKP